MSKKIALGAAGVDEQAFQAWGERAVGKENTKRWQKGKELLDHLIAASRDSCIEKVYIFSHAWGYSTSGNRGGVKLGGYDIAGFYLQPQIYDHDDARYIRDLARLIAQGSVRFCPESEIILTGCRVASSSFPQALAKVTESTVIASNGSSYPKPGDPPGDITGEWMSGVGGWEEQQAAKQGHYVGWIRYDYNRTTGEVTETEIGRKVDNGYLIDIY